MAALGAPVASDTFFALFGTPTLMWMVLHSVGYAEPPRYFWSEVVTKGQQWYNIWVTIPARADHHSGKARVWSQMGRHLGRVPKLQLSRSLVRYVRSLGMSLSMVLLDPFLEWTHHKLLGPNQMVMLW